MNIKEINEVIAEGEALKIISTAYTEITSIRLKKIRQEVIRTRAFFIEILNIYAMLRHITSGKLKHKISNLDANQTASIILTSNNLFYGHIEAELVDFFLSQRKDPGDIFVVGKSGKETFRVKKIPFTSVIFKSDIPKPEELIKLVDQVRNYHSILVYFARFKSVLKQEPSVVDITQSQAQAVLLSEKLEEAYIFEPEVNKIIDFFDAQLKQVLIEQTFLETELARTSSKLISMDQAQNNAEEFLKDQHRLLNHAKRSIQNVKILELVASTRKNRLQSSDISHQI